MSTLSAAFEGQDRAKVRELIYRQSLDIDVRRLALAAANAWCNETYGDRCPLEYAEALAKALEALLMESVPLREALYIVASELTLDAWKAGGFS